MTRRYLSLSVVLLTVTVWAADPPTFKIPKVDKPPALEDFLEMKPSPAWQGRLAKIENFVQRDPSDGKPASQRTEGYVGYDDKNFYAVFVCFDSEPGKIRARLGRRENIFEDDVVGVIVDTFHDRHRAYEFFVNPLGIQGDAITTEGSNDDFSWDTLWHSKGKLTAQGYVVWVAVPFKSMRFPSTDPQTWGFAMFRSIPRNANESSFWPYITRKVDGFAQQMATMEGLEKISPGRNIQLIPYGVFSAQRFLDSRNAQPQFVTTNDVRVGLDAKIVLHDSLTLDVALNPDFSQVESDDPQVTVNQRFEVFFPEKRPFFIENAAFFQTPVNLFFSRRIGDPEYGFRMTGKIGRWAIGALEADDRAPGKTVADNDPSFGERAHFTILRVNREWGKQSTFGAMYAERDFFGGFNRTGGVDTRWKINKNWVFNGQALVSSTRGTDQSYMAGPAYLALISRSSRKFNFFTGYQDYSPGFQTQTGFLQRVDIRTAQLEYGYRWRPEGKHLVSWGPHSYVEINHDHTGLRLDNNFYNDLQWEFRGNNEFGVFANFFRERLRPKDFSTLPTNQDFGRHAFGTFFSSSYFKKINFNAGLIRRQVINFDAPTGLPPVLGNSTNANAGFTVWPFGGLRIDNTYLLERLQSRTSGNPAIFNDHIIRSKWNWQFNKELSLRMILQYNALLANPTYTSLTTTKNFNADFLITYLLNPGTAFYVGYNGNLQNLDRLGMNRTRSSFIEDGKVFFVKLSYLLRF